MPFFPDPQHTITPAPNVEDRLKQAIELHQQGQWQAAQVLYLDILNEEISHPIALHHLGLIYIRNYHFAAGNAMLQRALQLLPEWVDGYYLYAQVLFEQKRYAHATQIAEKILQLHPGHTDALRLLIDAATLNQSALSSIKYIQQLLALEPQNLSLHEQLIQLLFKQKNYDNALKQIDKALEQFPHHAPFFKSKALCLYQLFELEAAQKACYRALSIDSNLPLMDFLLGNVFVREGQFQEAAAHYRQELTRYPKHPQVELNLAQSLLRQGNYAEGLALLEARHRIPPVLHPDIARWQGGDIKQNILLFADGDIGETILWLRYLPLLANRLRDGAKIYLELPAALVSLVQESSLGLHCVAIFDRAELSVATKTQIAQCALACPLSSVAHLMNTRADNIPTSKQYLHVQVARVARLVARLDEYARAHSYDDFSTQKIKIGLDFGNASNPIPLSQWQSSVQAFPNFSFYNLSDYSQALPEKMAHDGAAIKTSGDIEDYTSELTDRHDFACFIANLDIVISSNEEVAHLACALGITTIYLAPLEISWHWQAGQALNPWYPETAQVIRQSTYNDWSRPLIEVKEMLGRVYQKQFSTERVA